VAAWRPLALAIVVAAHACGGENHPKTFRGDTGGSGGTGGAFIDAGFHDGPPSPDASGLCGNQFIPVLVDPPNLYFIVDRSGSMAGALPGGPYTKYEGARFALADVLRVIGHRVKYGAAVYPIGDATGIQGCGSGQEIFTTDIGDPPTWAAAGEDGPKLKQLLTTLATLSPDGGTPTSATIQALAPTIKALPGPNTVVVLATDGAPNCNLEAVCPTSECQANIDGLSYNGTKCEGSFNCCDPLVVPNGQLNCVDRQATVAAVADLATAGIKTYVIGMPGSETYSSVLSQAAQAGLTEDYYSVTDADELTDALKKIGVKVAISCTIPLESVPEDPDYVNVYLDANLVLSDPLDGWKFIDEKTIELSGAACESLLSGNVIQVQVVTGCPTSVK
jgi:hypothetical protein